MLISLHNLIEAFDLNIKGILHIGAHYGQECETYLNCGITDMILFEPIKANFQELMYNMPISAKAMNIALGPREGITMMYVETANEGQSCSILEPFKHLEQYPSIKFDKKETVFMDKLDNIDFKRKDYNMINIDVQGFELEVFKGATETLKTIDYIYSEVNRDEVYKDCARVDQLDEFLSDYGFKRVITDWSGGIWGDALYVK